MRKHTHATVQAPPHPCPRARRTFLASFDRVKKGCNTRRHMEKAGFQPRTLGIPGGVAHSHCATRPVLDGDSNRATYYIVHIMYDTHPCLRALTSVPPRPNRAGPPDPASLIARAAVRLVLRLATLRAETRTQWCSRPRILACVCVLVRQSRRTARILHMAESDFAMWPLARSSTGMAIERRHYICSTFRIISYAIPLLRY